MIDSKNPLMSVVICTFSLKRFDTVVDCIRSIYNNTYKNYEIILVIDGNRELRQKIGSKFKYVDNMTIVENMKNEGPSASRNLGISCAKGDIIAFIDDDAIAPTNWLEAILKNFLDFPGIDVCGGKLIPIYEKGSRKLPEELLWIVGCTYRGHPEKRQFVRNVISANMAVRRQTFDEILFEKMFDGKNWKMEDTLFGIRVSMRNKDAILYDPKIIVQHHVSKDRTKLAYIFQRAYSEGSLKADLRIMTGKSFNNKIFYHEMKYFMIISTSILTNFMNLRIRNSAILIFVTISTLSAFILRMNK